MDSWIVHNLNYPKHVTDQLVYAYESFMQLNTNFYLFSAWFVQGFFSEKFNFFIVDNKQYSRNPRVQWWHWANIAVPEWRLLQCCINIR